MQFPAELLRECRFLAGPTASGKSAVALVLAERLGAEIVGLDSMTLYRGMDIGTAKPTARDRARVPHHLFDILDPSVECSVAEYFAAAEAACREIVARGRCPLFVGGTGLYLRSLLRGVFDGPPADPDLRERYAIFAERHGGASLHDELRKVDAVTAARLHPNDTRRVIRALEVWELTGRPLSAQQQQPSLPVDQRPRHVDWLAPERQWLHDRINRRVFEMFDAGLIDEVRALLSRPQPLSQTARQALGYQEVIDWLADPARKSLDQVMELIQTRTRQFAKRQHTWFRNLEECRPVPVLPSDSAESIVERLLSQDHSRH